MQGIGVNNSVNSNIYAFDAARVLEKYSDFAQGDANRVVVVSERALNSAAVDAIRKSVDKIGFGADACAWLNLVSERSRIDVEGDGPSGQDVVGWGCLTSDDVYDFIEGIDPICVVVADASSAKAVAQSYGEEVDCDAVNRVNGRTVVAFRNFEGMLDDEDSKQRAWRLLKRLHPMV